MTPIEVVGYIAALFVGISLGLIGGGGSILTVPILVYFFGIEPVMATAYSLFVVGVTSAAGVFRNIAAKTVDVKAAVVFSIPAIPAVFLTRRYLMPAIPEELTQIGDISLSKDLLIMAVFSVLMIFTSFSMIQKPRKESKTSQANASFNYPLILLEGAVVGVLTGFVGAGGGFLIIPALVLFSKLPMRKAIGTSLVIITLKSLLGFAGDLFQPEPVRWTFLLIFTLIAVIGIFIGTSLCRRIPADKLRPAFGWFVLLMGTYIIITEFLKA